MSLACDFRHYVPGCNEAFVDMSHPRKPRRADADQVFDGGMTIELPPAVANHIHAANVCDLDALLSTFVNDALVNDQLTEYWGKTAIATWAARDIIGERLTLKVVKAVQHYGHSIITAHASGSFDKRGLPDPLVLALYFSLYNNQIVELIILRNNSGI